MYGIVPMIAISATAAATLCALPYRAAMKSAMEVMFCALARRTMRVMRGDASPIIRIGPM
jgi:hypothetical protein